MSYFTIQLNAMKHPRILLSFLVCLAFAGSYAQKSQTAPPQGQQKVVKLKTAKPDTNDPNQKALNKFSKEQMYNVATPPKTLKPEEVKAMSFFTDGSKKGKAGKYEEAIMDFTKSLDLQKNPNTYVKRAYSYQMLGNYGAAISDANEALKMDETYLKAYFIRGTCKYMSGDYKGAKSDLFTYLDHDRTNAIAFNFMAALAFMEQDYKGALENYNEVVKLDPKYPDIYTNRGMMRHNNQDFKGAVQDYNEALKQNPDNATAYNNRGAAKLMLKDYKAALADFNKAISLNAKYADAYDNRGRTKHAMGDTKGACADWQAALANGLEASKELIIKYCK
jgi:tetratricopeptide (TPR) repeat protein